MIEGVHFVRSVRPGKPIRWYVYAWRGGPCILKAESPTKPKLGRAELQALSAAIEGSKAVRADTLAGLARQWRGSPVDTSTASVEWAALAASTRETWGFQLNQIEDKWGHTPLAVWNDPRMVAEVVAWRDSRSATPRSADIGVTVLGQLLEFARLRAKVRINVTEGIPQIYKAHGRAEIIWTDDDIARFGSARAAKQPVMDGLRLAAVTGFRRADLVGLLWAEVGEHAIVRTARKKSRGQRRRAVVPITAEAEALLGELRSRKRAAGVDHVLVTSAGRAWASPASFTASFNAARDEAGIIQPGDPSVGLPDRKKHLHDLRGTFVTKLCRAGLTNNEIADIVAWSPANVASIRKTYVDDAAIVVALSERIRRAG